MYGEFGDFFQPWNQISFHESHAFLHSPMMENLPESKEEEAQRSGFHQQISQYHEEEDKEEAAAMAMNLQSSVDDLFSDTMELASYLHRRVQEIGKQFRYCPFRINGNGKKESPFRFLHGLPCRSDLPCKAPIANSQRACDPAEHGNLHKKMENCVAEKEKASALAAEKIVSVEISSRVSFGPCFTNTFSPDFSGCRDTTGRTRKLHDHVFDAGRDGGVVLLLQDNRDEDAQVIPSTQRGEDITSSLQNPAVESALLLCPPLPRLLGPVSCTTNPENVSDTGLPLDSLPIQENQDHHMCLDPADALMSMPKEEKNPISSTAQLPLLCLTPCATSSENLLPLLQHSIPGMNSTENISNADLPLRMPSLQEHVCSDAEDPRVLFPMQKEGNFSRKPSQAGLYIDISENVRDADVLRKGVLIPVIQEHVEQQISLDAQDAQLPSSLAVAENSSPQSRMPHSMSSVDSSECDNCGLENVTGHLMADMPRSKNSTIASGQKSDETDAMSEAGCLDTHKKEENDDEGTIVAVGVDTACAGLEEMKNGALDLLLNAIQATSGGDFADNDGDDVCRPSSSHMNKHVLGAGGDGTVGERKEHLEPSSSQVIQRMRKASTNGQLGFSEITHGGDIHLVSKSLQDIQDYTRERKLSSNVVPLHVGKFPIVRKRSARFPKIALKEEPSGNSVPIVMRFKSLQAVSKVDFSSRKSKKKPSDNKQEKRRKRPLLEMQERGHILHVSPANLGRRDSKMCLVPKQEKREKPLDMEVEGWEREDSSSKQEKRARHSDDLQETQGIEQTSTMYEPEAGEAKDEEEPVVFSRRGRSQILPNKFSDSVLQPWKKRDRRKDQ